MERLPLYGFRILDLTATWDGQYGTRLLADMGAEVIRVEPPSSGDTRRSAMFNHVNRNKYACTLDLAAPRARELFQRLVALSDVVVQDYAPGEPRLSYEALRSARADIIVVSVTGDDGPAGSAYAEPAAGIAAAGAVGLALWHRRRSGEGQHVEVAPLGAVAGLAGEYALAASMSSDERSGRPPSPADSRHPSLAPRGCYPCADKEQWVAIAAEGDGQFAALCRAMGRRELAADPRFADIVSRYRNRDELDGIVGEWTGHLTPLAVTEALQAAGVAAAPVLGVPALFEDPHLRARRFWESVSHPEAGTWDVDGVPWRLSRSPAHIRLPAPILGEHNEYVLRGLLGLSEEEVRELGR